MSLVVTNEIIDWCREQQYAHFYHDSWLLFAAMLFIAIMLLIKEFKLDISSEKEPYKVIIVASYFLLYGALFMLGTFLVTNL